MIIGIGFLFFVYLISPNIFYVFGIPVSRNDNDTNDTSRYLQKANEILDRMPVIDGHNDLEMNFRELFFNDLREVNFSTDLTKVDSWRKSTHSHTDLPRIRKGKVGGQFWSAYTSCASNNKDSVAQTIEQIDVLKRFFGQYPNDLQFTTSAAGIEAAISAQKIASLIGVEGGHSIQSSASILRTLYELGARYLTLTHNCNTPWADSALVDAATNPEEASNDGLSDFGLQIIDEMNRLGMMVDLSHTSAATMKEALERTKAPIIFSHSNTRAICNHHRNVPEDVLFKVKENDGLIMVNFNWPFVQCDKKKNATIKDLIAHMDHIKNTIGADHIGIGSDFDGVPKLTQELEDVSKYPALFAALLETGNWNEEELEKVAGRNLLRVFKKVEEVRDSLRNQRVMQTVITREENNRAHVATGCITANFIDDENKTAVV